MMIACNTCGTVADESHVFRGQEMMRSLPARYNLKSEPEELRKMLQHAESILHPSNIYVCRLKTAIFHLTGSLHVR